MIKLLKLLIVFIIYFPSFSLAQADIKTSIDYTSLDAFWGIVEKIKYKKAFKTDWDYLFSTPYYSFYENWGQRQSIQSNLITAFSPENIFKRDSLMRLNDFTAHILKHLISAYEAKGQLQSLKQTLIKGDLINDVLTRTIEFLPSNLDPLSMKEPVICFGVFQPDANASHVAIAMDLKLYFDLADPVGILAHEVHHFLTYNYRRKFKEIKNDSTKLIMHAISQLQLEGIADMIDKETFLNSDGKGFPAMLIETYRKAYFDPLPNLKLIDSLLVSISKDASSSERNSKAIIDLLPLGGHPHGFHMARTILDVEGKDALLRTTSNPFDFIRLYNLTWKKITGTPIFSKVSIEFLNQLEGTHSF